MEIPIRSLTTDRHLQIQAYVRDYWPEIDLFHDTWHIAKGLIFAIKLRTDNNIFIGNYISRLSKLQSLLAGNIVFPLQTYLKLCKLSFCA